MNNKSQFTLVFMLGFSFLARTALAEWGNRGWGMGPAMMGWGWGMGFGWFFMLIFWVLVILGVLYIIRFIAGSTKEKKRRRQPLISLRRDMQEER